MGLSVTTLDNLDRYVRAIIYGPPGAGKTTLAATAPTPTWLDFENSTESIRVEHGHIRIAGTPRELRNAENVLQFVKDFHKSDSETLVIDTLSSMYTVFLQDHMKDDKDRHLARFEDFRILTNVMKEIFTELISIEKHVVLIAHEKYWRDKETNVVKEVRPALPPEVESSIERLVNECFYLEKKTNAVNKSVKRTLTVSSEGKIFAKNRQGFIDPTIEEPTWEKIYTWA